MCFEPSPDDVVARISLNPREAATAADALRACLPLVSDLAPREVQAEAADECGLRTGFIVELLVVLPSAEGDGGGGADAGPGGIANVLRAASRPLIARLGLDEKRFVYEETGDYAHVKAGRDEPESGAYLMLLRLGADPLAETDDEDDDEDDGPEELVPEGPQLSDEQVQDLLCAMGDAFGDDADH